MTVRWLVSNLGSAKSMDALKEAIERNGYLYEQSYDSKIFSSKYDFTVDSHKYIRSTFYYGSVDSTDKVFRDKKQVNPILDPHEWPCFFKPELSTCRFYYAKWGRELLSHFYTMMPLAEVFRRQDYLFEHFGRVMEGITGDVVPINDNAIFIRPDENDKCFTGRLIFQSEFHKWKEYVSTMNMSVHPDTLCVVAEPTSLLEEYRCLIRRGKFVTGSRYYEWDQDNLEMVQSYGPCPQDVVDYANSIPQLDETLPLYMLDIARTRESPGELRVVEMGSVHCAGLYDMNLDKYVQAVSEEVINDIN